MEKIKFIFSYIFMILGICIITFTQIAKAAIPKSGYHDVQLGLNYWIAAICIICGMIYIIKNSKIIDHSLNKIKLRNKEFDEEHNSQ